MSYLPLIKAIRALDHEIDERLREGLRAINLSCVQADALMALHQLQPCTLTTLSQHLFAESGHPSRLVSRMRDRDLVKVAPSPDDGRAMLIGLTPLGSELAAKAFSIRQGILDQLDLEPDDTDQASATIDTLRQQLRARR